MPLPPDILLDPENITVYEGEEAAIKCLFFSTAPVNIWWNKMITVNGSKADEHDKPYKQSLDDKVNFSITTVSVKIQSNFISILPGKTEIFEEY